ncbi:MAG: enoyl-CoA hydratase-related protein [Dehalococcoidia bacterium]
MSGEGPAGQDGENGLLLRKHGQVATVVINRPEQRNAISHAMWQRMPSLFRELEADPDVRVVLLTGAGNKAFSAGADIKDFEESRSTPKKASDYRGHVESACEALGALSKPTIAVIRGYCIGGGFELSLCADLRIGSTDAQTGLPAAKRGLAAAHHFVERMVALCGAGHTAYLLLSGRLVDASTAASMGILNAVHPAGELDGAVQQLVDEMLELSPVSLRLHKAIIRDIVEYGSRHHVPADRLAAASEAERSEDFKEGVRAFLEKRKPRFPGR